MKSDSISQNLNHLLILGFTGGIGCGKSTGGNFFSQMGVPIINADDLAHHFMTTTPVKEELRNFFGGQIFDSFGNIDSSALAKLVFGQGGEELEKLTGVIHPLVRREISRQLVEWNRKAEEEKARKLVLLDVPLLLESPLRKFCQVIVFIDTPYQKRLERVQTTRGWTEEELLKREHFQMSLEEKRDQSDYCVNNRGTLDSFQAELQKLWSHLRATKSL